MNKDEQYLASLLTCQSCKCSTTKLVDKYCEQCYPAICYEQERIIKLLEDPVIMSNWWSQVDKNLGLYGNLKNYVIALIKGEK